MHCAGAGIRSAAKPFLDATSNFAEIVLRFLASRRRLKCRRILERTVPGRADAKANGVKVQRRLSVTPRQQRTHERKLPWARRSVAHGFNRSGNDESNRRNQCY
jgi:hypothetical protein